MLLRAARAEIRSDKACARRSHGLHQEQEDMEKTRIDAVVLVLIVDVLIL